MGKFIKHISSIASIFVLVLLGGTTYGISQSDYDAVYGNTIFYDPDFELCDKGSSSASPGLVYVLGDSIANGAKSAIEGEFSDGGWSVHVNAVNGRPLAADTVTNIENNPQELEKLEQSTAVVVELGANNLSGDISTLVSTTYTKIRQLNSTTRFFWVDIGANPAATFEQYNANNRAIYTQALSNGFEVVPWAKAVFGQGADPVNIRPISTDENNYLSPDKLHPNATGNSALAELIAQSVKVDSGGFSGTGSANLVGENNVEKSFNYLISRGLTAEQAAGVVGNLQAESGDDINPEINQIGGGPGRGIAQWEYQNGNSDRWSNVLAFAASQGRDPLTLDLQLDYLWFEFTGVPPTEGARGGAESAAYDHLIQQTGVYEAAASFMTKFERPRDQSPAKQRARGDKAQLVFDQYGNNSASALSRSGECSVGEGSVASVNGLSFPLITTKSRLGNWDPTVSDHPYLAHDIFEEPGTEIVVVEAGEVTRVSEKSGGVGSSAMIVGAETGDLYYYTHMTFNSVRLTTGQEVQSGDVIGTVGPSEQAQGTSPHLHFDVTKAGSHNGFRQACSRQRLDLCYKIDFVDFKQQLTLLYEALGE